MEMSLEEMDLANGGKTEDIEDVIEAYGKDARATVAFCGTCGSTISCVMSFAGPTVETEVGREREWEVVKRFRAAFDASCKTAKDLAMVREIMES